MILFLYRFVSRHELFPLRAPLLSMEPCISEFLDKCDSNQDHKITLKEWGSCLGAEDGKIKKINLKLDLKLIFNKQRIMFLNLYSAAF